MNSKQKMTALQLRTKVIFAAASLCLFASVFNFSSVVYAGGNVSNDHDDWSAVLLAMSKFNGTHTDISAGANTSSGTTLATITRERKINEEAPIQDEELQKAADEYEKSHKPNTIENVMEQDEELRKAIEDGEGKNVSAKNQTSTSEVAESNTSTDPANSNTLLIAGLAAAGVVAAGIATLLVIKRRK